MPPSRHPIHRAEEQGWPEFVAWVAGAGAIVAAIAFVVSPTLVPGVLLLASLGIGAYALGLALLYETRDQHRELRHRLLRLEEASDAPGRHGT